MTYGPAAEALGRRSGRRPSAVAARGHPRLRAPGGPRSGALFEWRP
jgi:hypothetical protein